MRELHICRFMTITNIEGARVRSGGEEGFSLLEAVVAAGLVAGACAALAQLLAMSIANNVSARSASVAAVLAAQKMEQLREGPWEVAGGGIDYVAETGDVLGRDATMPPAAAYVRRWTSDPLPASGDVLVVHVTVATTQGRDVARLVTLRARKTP